MDIEADPFAGRLLSGERVVWNGRPATGLMFSAKDVFLVPFSVLWIGFAVVWTGIAAGTGAGPGFVLYGLMFVVVGTALMWGRFFADAWLRKGIRYALTDRRVLISRRLSRDFVAVNLDRLPDARLTERKDGRGTIRFGQQSSLFSAGGFATWLPALDSTPQFLAIPDARRVFDMVQRSSGRA